MFSKLIRRVHMYLALFLTPWMLMYALSTLAMNHHALFVGEGETHYELERELSYDGTFPPDASDRMKAEQILANLELDGVFSLRGSEPGRLVITRENPVRNHRVTFEEAAGTLRIESGAHPPGVALERMHRASGYDSGSALRTAWAVLVDVVIVGIVFWCLSGLYLWWLLKKTRWIGALCAVGGVLFFGLFLVSI